MKKKITLGFLLALSLALNLVLGALFLSFVYQDDLFRYETGLNKREASHERK